MVIFDKVDDIEIESALLQPVLFITEINEKATLSINKPY